MKRNIEKDVIHLTEEMESFWIAGKKVNEQMKKELDLILEPSLRWFFLLCARYGHYL